jgi:uncharacterized NAD(P)/FAD-binding protein YdhS
MAAASPDVIRPSSGISASSMAAGTGPIPGMDRTEIAHRINVPAAKMSIDPDVPSHFMDWLASPAGPMLDPASAMHNEDFFPPRAVFGAYMADCLKLYLHSGSIRHLRQTASKITQDKIRRGYDIVLSDQSLLHADIVMLAASHPLPDLPAELRHLNGSHRIIADPTIPTVCFRSAQPTAC